MSGNVVPLRRGGTHLALRSAAGEKKGQQTYEWVGSWPPPDKLVVIIEKASHQSKVLNPAEQHPDTIPSFVGRPGYDVLEFVLNKLGDMPANPLQTWWAEYVVLAGVRGASTPRKEPS
ncbi:MAG TPA: hypothetical protein VGN19_03750 [Pedococcus sp.]|jgi:hypothetical protein|nr:hypothetical protein [Pedococcus sp.]